MKRRRNNLHDLEWDKTYHQGKPGLLHKVINAYIVNLTTPLCGPVEQK